MTSPRVKPIKKTLVSISQDSKIFLVLILLVLLGLGTNFFTEYGIDGFSKYAIKHLVVFLLTLLSAVLWKTRIIRPNAMFLILIYSNILSSTIFLPFRAQDPDLNFEGYFSRVEMIFFVMGLLLAVFERPWHQFIVIGYNTIYIIACTILIPNIEFGKFVLAFLIISSVGAISYFVFAKVIKMSNYLQIQNDKIKKQNTELHELTKFRKEIMQIIAHDLRSPMLQISTLVDLTIVEENEANRNNYLGLVKTSIDKTQSMLEGLLDWAMQSDDSVKSYIHLNVHEVVEQLKSQFQAKLNNKKLRVENVVSENLSIYYSKQVFETALRNLLTNAIKFSPFEEQIIVETIENNEYFKFRVINKANDVDEEKFDLINMGKIVNSSRGTGDEIGSGKGLSILNKILEKNKANLRLSTKGDNVIATISIDKQALENLEKETVEEVLN